MRPPKNLDDLGSLTKFIDGKIKTWCVECERWAEVIVVATATVTYRQNKWTNKTENAFDIRYHCGTHNCGADVEYLLNNIQKIKILDLAEAPTRISKPAIIQPPRQIRQLRMKI
jgi:hypothetical protein